MLIEQGYAGLSMDRLAEATEYSKGTIYQHFSTKEDLITALAVESSEQRLALMAKARTFRGRPRERMLALGSLTNCSSGCTLTTSGPSWSSTWPTSRAGHPPIAVRR